ncbi:MAG: DUF1080 domain-containing protein [Mangrovibacterium sp.]
MKTGIYTIRMKKKNILQSVPCYLLLVVFVVYGCRSANKPTSEQTDTDEGFIPIFDGKTLSNWEGDPAYWRVENGCLTGEVTPTTLLNRNTFVIWKGGAPKDFEMKLEFRISKNGNSGINYRSEPIDSIPFALKGYQCDIDGQNRYTGQNYEERKRTTLAYRGQKVIVNVQANPESPGSLNSNIQKNAWQSVEVTGSLGEPDSLNTYIHDEDWNTCHLVVNGNRMQHYINDVLMSDVTDNDSINRSFSGLIGVQVHVGPPMKVEYRNIRLKEFKQDQ